MRDSWARISEMGRPVWRVSREANSARRERRRDAARERTAKRVEGSARDQAPLWKWAREEVMVEVTAERGVEGMVAIRASVAGL